MAADPRLVVDFEAALVRELARSWHDVNATWFRAKLRPPAITLSDATSRLGRWDEATRTIEIARSLVRERPWGVVLEVLKHEVAHQWVHEGLGIRDETAHGPAFREVCAKLGIDAAATGMPEAGGTTAEEARVLERIAKLLALAESPNAHEAENAASAAQRLMLRHNLDGVRARAPRGYSFRHLGEPSGRVLESERLLAALLAEHFFVEAIWVPTYRAADGKRGRVLEICGTPANLELAAYVHAFLRHAADGMWREHKRARGIRADRDRQTFLAGVMTGFREKLRAEQSRSRGEGLVWVGDAELDRYLRRRHPHVRWSRYQGHARTEAHAEGRAAGRRLVLHKGVAGEATSHGRLLPPKR